MATQRANFTGDVSDQKLNVLYKVGRQWYLRHAANPQPTRCVKLLNRLPFRSRFPPITPHSRASQTKSYNTFTASQKQSFDEQLGRGQ